MNRERVPLSWSLLGLLALPAATAAGVWYLLTAKDPATASAVIQAVLAGFLAIAAAIGFLWPRYIRMWTVADETLDTSLDRLANELASQLYEQAVEAIRERRLWHPTPILVSWEWSMHLNNPPSEAIGRPGGTARFAPLPGVPPVTATRLAAGGQHDLLGLYGGLRSGRLVLLGDRGAGKSAAALLLLLGALEHRASLMDVLDLRRTPVPVLVSLGGWDPRTTTFVDWLSERLVLDHALLRSPRYRPATVAGLIQAGRLAVFLDDLDELPKATRALALTALNFQAGQMRIVLLSRTGAMIEASADEGLAGAAVLELQPVTSDAAADYLTNSRRQPMSQPWVEIITTLRADHGSVGALARALDSPLMLTLLRDTYGEHGRVNELLDTEAFSSPEEITGHLLDRVVPVAYAYRPQGDNEYGEASARQWLGMVARLMIDAGTPDLGWWRIRYREGMDLGPRSPSIAGKVAPGLWVGLAVGTATATAAGLSTGPRMGVAVGLASALVAAAAVVLGSVLGSGVVRMGNTPRHLARFDWSRLLTRTNMRVGAMFGTVFGFAAGIPAGFGTSQAFGFWIGLVSALVIGTTAGTMYGLNGLIERSSAVDEPTDPMKSWRRDNRLALTVGLVAAVVSGSFAGLVFGLGAISGQGKGAGIAFGAVFGVTFGIGSALWVSRTFPVALAFIRLHRRYGTPVRFMRFLEDARSRQILRTNGAAYQFRHDILRQRLVEQSVQSTAISRIAARGRAAPRLLSGLRGKLVRRLPLAPHRDRDRRDRIRDVISRLVGRRQMTVYDSASLLCHKAS